MKQSKIEQSSTEMIPDSAHGFILSCFHKAINESEGFVKYLTPGILFSRPNKSAMP